MNDVNIKGFDDLAKTPAGKLKRVIVCASAMFKCGKTNFGLTAPSPLAYLNLDQGEDGVAQKFIADGKRILQCKIEYDAEGAFGSATTAEQEHWKKAKKRLKEGWLDALNTKGIRSVVVDTDTEAWEVFRLAEFGRSSALARNYGPVNAEYNALMRAVLKTDKNLIILQKLKELYVNDKGTGRLVASGFKGAEYNSQVNVRLWRGENDDHVGIRIAGGEFGMTIISSRNNPDLDGEELVGPMVNFTTLAMMIHPDTEESDWEG